MTGNVPFRLVRSRLTGPLMVAPTILAIGVFAYWPVLRSAYLSVHGSDLFGRPSGFVGVQNYLRIVTDPDLRQVIVTTLVTCALSVALATGTALLAALALRRTGRRPAGILSLVFSLPFAYSAGAASATFAGMLSPVVGTLDQLIAALGGTGPDWLGSPGWAVVSISVATAWYEFGFAFLVLVAALNHLDREVIEAAALDGAGEWRTAVSIIVPALRPSLIFLVTTQTVTGLQIFTQVKILTDGGPGDATHTLVYELYDRAFGSGLPQYGVASALALLLLVLVLAVVGVQFALGRER